MKQYPKWLPRFGLKHLSVAVVAASVGLTAYVMISRSMQRAIIDDVYGRYEVYQLLRNSSHFELFRVNKKEDVNAIYWQIPNETWIARSGFTADRTTEPMRKLLTTPQNFHTRFVKDFVFSPTVRLRTAPIVSSVDIYFCFRSKEAAIVQNSKIVSWLPLDNISNELNELFATSMAEEVVR